MKPVEIIRRSSAALIVALTVAPLAACGGADEGAPGGETGQAETEEPAAAQPTGATQEAPLPDTTLEAVWSYLQAEDSGATGRCGRGRPSSTRAASPTGCCSRPT